MTDDLIERLRNARDLGDDLGAFDAAIDALAAAQARIAELEEDRDDFKARFEKNFDLRHDAQARIEELENRIVLVRAEADGVGSLLLDVQRDCIAAVNRLAEVEQERDEQTRLGNNALLTMLQRAEAAEKERDAARAAFERFSDWIPADMAGRIGIAAEWCALADLMRPALSGDAHA